MVVVLIQGGLGNQLFEYATAYSLSKRNQTDTFIYKGLMKKQPFSFKLDKFDIPLKEIAVEKLPIWIRFIIMNHWIHRIIIHFPFRSIKIGNWIYVMQRDPTILNKIISSSINVFLDGYWQYPWFFKTYEEDIKSMYVPSIRLSEECKKWEASIRKEESVSVHIRRGDYLEKKNAEYRIKDDYYDYTIAYIKEIKPNASFFVFSNDKKWAKEHYPNFKIVDFHSENVDIEELYLISCCKYNINANSTYSWWGSYLNRNVSKIVINPDRPWNRAIFPDDWIVAQNSEENNKKTIQLYNKGIRV